MAVPRVEFEPVPTNATAEEAANIHTENILSIRDSVGPEHLDKPVFNAEEAAGLES